MPYLNTLLPLLLLIAGCCDNTDKLIKTPYESVYALEQNGTIIDPIVIDRSDFNHHYLHVLINGHTVRCMVDTGATRLSINHKLVDKIGAEIAGEVKMVGAGATFTSNYIKVREVKVGAHTINDVTGASMPVDSDIGYCLLGMDILQHFNVQYNRISKQLKIYR